jgi:hypothetical protein
MNKTFTLYWLDGKREFVTGPDIAQACTNAGYGNGAMTALDFYTEGANNEYNWNPTIKDWFKKGPVMVTMEDVAGLSQDELTRMLQTSTQIKCKLRNGDELFFQQSYSESAVGWIKYLMVFYGEHVKVENNEDLDHVIDVYGPVFFNHDDYAAATTHFKERAKLAMDLTSKAVKVGWVEGSKNMDEIKANQPTIPL